MKSYEHDTISRSTVRSADQGGERTSLEQQPVRPALQLQRVVGNRVLRQALLRSRAAGDDAEIAPEVERAIRRKRGGGQALDAGVRTQMESALDADFGGVRVHADGEAHALNRSLNARAFTTGRDVFFQRGAYSPGTSAGRQLIAHELTHVVQQGGHDALPQSKLSLGRPGDRLEQEAEQVAQAVNRAAPELATAGPSAPLNRAAEEDEPVQASATAVQRDRVQREEEDEGVVQARHTDNRVRRELEPEADETEG